jgi:hypothetical protein
MKEGYIIRKHTLIHFITATVVDCIDVLPLHSKIRLLLNVKG